jgi:hypothetical protein
MSKQPIAADSFGTTKEANIILLTIDAVMDPSVYGDDCPPATPFPNPILVVKPEFKTQARFVGSSIKDEAIEINITLVNYRVTFFVNKKLIKETCWESLKNVTMEGIASYSGEMKANVGLRELTAKLDTPVIHDNLLEIYKNYLENKLRKRNSTPVADRIRAVSRSIGKEDSIQVEATKKALIEMLRTNQASSAMLQNLRSNMFKHNGLDSLLTLMLAIRGTGPAEVCFTNSFLKKASYRLSSPMRRLEREATILYFANSMPKGVNRFAIKSWKTALGKLTAIGRRERLTKNTATCIRFFAKLAQPKSGTLKLKLKLLKQRIWQVNFVKRIKMILRFSWSIRMRASAEHRPSTEPPEPPMSQIHTHTQSLRNDADREIQEILHRLKTLDNDFMLSTEGNKTIEDGLKTNSEAIDEVRQEMLALALESKEELLELKKQIHGSQSQLGDLRQSKSELETVLAKFAEEKQKMDNVAQAAIKLAKEESKQSIEECKNQLLARINNMPAEFKMKSDEAYAGCVSLKAELKGIHNDYVALGTEELKHNIRSHTKAMFQFSKGIPDLEMRMGEIERTLSSQARVMIEARNMLDELGSVTKSTAAKLAREKGLEEDRRKIEVYKLRKQGKSVNSAKRTAAKENLKSAENKVPAAEDAIKAEISTAVPRIAGFVREWNSLKKGDLFNFGGRLLTIDDTFNPSIRVKECGQEALKWEAQKFANGMWYLRGYLSISG